MPRVFCGLCVEIILCVLGQEGIKENKLFFLQRSFLGSSKQFTLWNCRDGRVGANTFSHCKKGDGYLLYKGRFRSDIRKNVFTERVINDWNRLPREMVESPSLEVFKRCVDGVLRDVV